MLRRAPRKLLKRSQLDGVESVGMGALLPNAALPSILPVKLEAFSGEVGDLDTVVAGHAGLKCAAHGLEPTFGQCLASVTHLVSGGVVGLQVKEPLKICHLPSLTRERSRCRIDQLIGTPGSMVVVVEVRGTRVVVEVEELEVVDREVVVVVRRVVEVVDEVDAESSGWAPFRMP